MKKSPFLFLLFTLICAVCPLLTGCGQQGTTSTMSKEEESHFKGGPMPPEARKAMQEADKKRAAATAGAPGNPPSAPSNP